jgi:hypothetical protein
LTPTITSPAVHSRSALVSSILALSAADVWDEAKREWDLESVWFAEPDEPWRCMCGHSPIREVCVIRNRLTGHRAEVGNVCVTRFLGLPSGDLFAALKRVARNPAAALSPAAVEYAHGRGWMNDWERSFCLDTAKRRKLSARQRAKRAEINTRVLARITTGE